MLCRTRNEWEVAEKEECILALVAFRYGFSKEQRRTYAYHLLNKLVKTVTPYHSLSLYTPILSQQRRQILLDIFDHGIRPLVHLQPLRQREGLEIGHDLFSDSDDLACLLRRPHGCGELATVLAFPFAPTWTSQSTYQNIRLGFLDRLAHFIYACGDGQVMLDWFLSILSLKQHRKGRDDSQEINKEPK